MDAATNGTQGRTLLDLRADAAKRNEDLRIARKHLDEAAARDFTPENALAYQRQMIWFEHCRDADDAARALVIQAVQDA